MTYNTYVCIQDFYKIRKGTILNVRSENNYVVLENEQCYFVTEENIIARPDFFSIYKTLNGASIYDMVGSLCYEDFKKAYYSKNNEFLYNYRTPGFLRACLFPKS